jgi:hypothetical protein
MDEHFRVQPAPAGKKGQKLKPGEEIDRQAGAILNMNFIKPGCFAYHFWDLPPRNLFLQPSLKRAER